MAAKKWKSMEAATSTIAKPTITKMIWRRTRSSSASSILPATAERIMAMPKMVKIATAPSSQKSKVRQEVFVLSMVYLTRRLPAGLSGMSAINRCWRPSCVISMRTAPGSMSTCLEITAINSSFSNSNVPGFKSVRSWINTSFRRSLAWRALFFFRPRSLSRMALILCSSWADQASQPAQQAALVVEVKEGHRFAAQPGSNVAEGQTGPAFAIQHDRHSAVDAQGNVLVFRYDADQFDSQQ